MTTLPELYRVRAGLGYSRKQLAEQIEREKILLTYTGELIGKDAEARKREYALAQEKVYLADKNLQTALTALSDLDFQIAVNTGEIEAMEAERRIDEWSTRRAMVEALGGRVFTNSNNTAPGDDTHAFDDTALKVTDAAVFDNIPF